MDTQEELDILMNYKKDDLLVLTTLHNDTAAYKRIGEFKEFTSVEVNGKSVPGLILKFLGNEIKIPAQAIKDGKIRRAYETEEILWKLQNEDGDIKSTIYNNVFDV